MCVHVVSVCIFHSLFVVVVVVFVVAAFYTLQIQNENENKQKIHANLVYIN